MNNKIVAAERKRMYKWLLSQYKAKKENYLDDMTEVLKRETDREFRDAIKSHIKETRQEYKEKKKKLDEWFESEPTDEDIHFVKVIVALREDIRQKKYAEIEEWETGELLLWKNAKKKNCLPLDFDGGIKYVKDTAKQKKKEVDKLLLKGIKLEDLGVRKAVDGGFTFLESLLVYATRHYLEIECGEKAANVLCPLLEDKGFHIKRIDPLFKQLSDQTRRDLCRLDVNTVEKLLQHINSDELENMIGKTRTNNVLKVLSKNNIAFQREGLQ